MIAADEPIDMGIEIGDGTELGDGRYWAKCQVRWSQENEIEVISTEIRMEMKRFGHNNDLDRGLVVSDGFLESIFEVSLSAKSASTTEIVRKILVRTLVDER